MASTASIDRKYLIKNPPNRAIYRAMPYLKASRSTIVNIEYEGQNVQPKKSGNLELEVKEANLYVLGIPLHYMSKPSQMAICCGGVMIFYLIYGYVQEWIFRIEGFKPYGWYLTLVQFAFYSLFGTIQRTFLVDKTRKIPLKTYTGLAFLTVATMGLSNSSLGFLNYPTQVIFKSCKLIPVMIGGILIQGKQYKLVDFLACLCMSVGLILFTLADSKVQPHYNNTGVILISLALCSDAVIGNVQEKAIKSHKSSNSEMVLYSYGIGFLYILVGLIITGQLWDAVSFSSEKPMQVYSLAFLFALSGYLGISFVLMLVRIFGALTAVTITTFRKAVTMILSFVFFSKPFTMQKSREHSHSNSSNNTVVQLEHNLEYSSERPALANYAKLNYKVSTSIWNISFLLAAFRYVWSGFIVFTGIFLNVYSKNQVKMNDIFYSYTKKLSSISLYRGQRAVKLTTNDVENV